MQNVLFFDSFSVLDAKIDLNSPALKTHTQTFINKWHNYNIATTAHLAVKHLAILPQTYTFTDDKKFNITLSSACSGSF